MTGTALFAGAGPGDPDLPTVKGRALIECAGAILFSGSLVNEVATRWARPGCMVADTKDMTPDQRAAWLIGNVKRHEGVIRLQVGAPALYRTLIEVVSHWTHAANPGRFVPGISSAIGRRGRGELHAAGTGAEWDPNPYRRLRPDAASRDSSPGPKCSRGESRDGSRRSDQPRGAVYGMNLSQEVCRTDGSVGMSPQTMGIRWPRLHAALSCGRAVLLACGVILFSAGLQAQVPSSPLPVRLTDQRGVEVKLPHAAQRIVTIPVPMASIVMALDGASRRVVGMHPASRQSIEKGFLRKVFPEALKIPADITRGGMFTPNLEAVLALKPDVVVTWSEPAEAVESLERAGLRVVALTNDPPNLARHFSNLEILGKLIGREDRVAAVRADLERKRDAVSQAMSGIAVKPRVIYLRQGEPSLQASGLNTFQDFWINLAGGRNVAGLLSGHQQQTTLEQLIAWDPEIIFLGTFDAATPADIYANLALSNVSAVRSRRVLKVPHGGYRWDPGSHESGLMMLWAAATMHPERFKPEMRREMRATYAALYRHRLSEAEIDDILEVRANAATPGYAAQFAR